MTDLKLDEYGRDLVIEDGDLVFTETLQYSARQCAVMTMRTYRGEWFRDVSYGVPWIANKENDISILGKVPKGLFDSYVRGGILYNDEVEAIKTYQSDKDPYSGKVTITSTVEVPTGEIVSITAEVA